VGLYVPLCKFNQNASFTLTKDEAEYLQHRISELGPTLLNHLVNQTMLVDGGEFPWDHPKAPSFPESLKVPLQHARLFSEVMHGAALLYNLMLAEQSGEC
jgi:Family of unknown function (DUF6361)